MTPPATLRLVSAALAGGVLLAACGSGGSSSAGVAATPVPEADRSATQILADAGATIAAAMSFTLRGSIRAGGGGTAGTVTLDITASRGDSRGTLVLGGQSVEYVVLDGVYYIKAPDTLKAALGTIPPSLAGTFLRIPAGFHGAEEFTSRVAEFADGRTLAREIAQTIGPLTRRTTGTVDGEPVVEVDDSQSAFFVTTTGSPRLLRVAQLGGGSQVEIGGYDVPVTIAAPANSVDITAVEAMLATPSPAPG